MPPQRTASASGAPGLWEKRHAKTHHAARARRRQQSSPIYTVLALGLIAVIGVYLYTGFEESYNRITSNEAERLAAQPKQSPVPLTSRAEYDQRRTEPYKNAVQNSPGLATSQKHNEDIKQLMQPASNKRR